MLYKSACQIHYCDNGHHESISKIYRTLREGLEGETLLPFYMITSVGKYGSKRHGVRLEKLCCVLNLEF